MRASTLESAADEWDVLFGGVGKPEVFLYGSYHLAGFLNERPLAALREDLARLGLARDTLHHEAPEIARGVDDVLIDGPPRIAALLRSALLDLAYVVNATIAGADRGGNS